MPHDGLLRSECTHSITEQESRMGGMADTFLRQQGPQIVFTADKSDSLVISECLNNVHLAERLY